MSTTQYLSCAETAKLLRNALKAKFPGVKFSVRSETYAGGASINVSWTDGPTERAVDSVCFQFKGADFDGMQDLKTCRIAEVNGQRVRYGSDFIFTRRSYTRAILERVAVRIRARWGADAASLEVQDSQYEPGTAKFHAPRDLPIMGTYSIVQIAYQEAGRAFLTPSGFAIEKQ